MSVCPEILKIWKHEVLTRDHQYIKRDIDMTSYSGHINRIIVTFVSVHRLFPERACKISTYNTRVRNTA